MCQAFDGLASLLFSYRCWCVGREATVMAPSPMRAQQYHLAFLHRHFPPQSPPSHPFDPFLYSQQQPSPWDFSTIPKLQLPAAAPSSGPAPLPGVCTAVARTVIFIPFRLPQISCFILSLKCLSSDSDNCPSMGIGPLLQFPHLPRAGPVLHTLLFVPLVPSSYQVVHV